jgi:ABC-type Fe3+ transport system permease subunit
MSKLSYKISYYVLYVMFAALLIVLALFYAGGEMTTPIVASMSNPKYTDALLFLIYGLFGLAILVTLVGFIFQFVSSLKDNPVATLKSLTGIILLAILLIVTYSIGSGEPLVITGYEGTENVPFWLKISDMFLYTLYTLIIICCVAMLFGGIKKRLS